MPRIRARQASLIALVVVVVGAASRESVAGTAPQRHLVTLIASVPRQRIYAQMSDGGLFRLSASGSWIRTGQHVPGFLALISDGTLNIEVADGRHDVFASRDGGITWRVILGDVHGGWALGSPGCPLLIGSSPDEESLQGGGLYRSVDGGVNWSRRARLGKFSASGEISGLASNCASGVGAVILAGTQAWGVYRSTDRGASWMLVTILQRHPPSHDPIVSTIQSVPAAPMDFWAGSQTNDGVFRSSDGGKTWTRAGLRGWFIDDIGVDDSDAETVMAIGSSSVDFGPMRTVDGGRHWSHIRGLPRRSSAGFVEANHRAYAWTRRAVYVSRDQGASWARLPLPD